MKCLFSSVLLLVLAGCQKSTPVVHTPQPTHEQSHSVPNSVDDDAHLKALRAMLAELESSEEPVDDEKLQNLKMHLALLEEEARRTIDVRRDDDPRRCYKHNVRLQDGIASLQIGMPARSFAAEVEPRELFPNAHSVHQTCFHSDALFARVRYCRVCRDVERQWRSGKRGDEIKVPTPEELAREEQEEEVARFR